MLIAMIRGYLDDSLATTLYFRNLEQSEKVGVSFLLGEAFAHWFAQHHMQVPILVHVAGLPGCQWASASTTLALKIGAQLPAEKSRPDFIGIRLHERHVFESKGRIRHPSTQTIAKALGQVSKIATINGAIPTTRCVTAFTFKASGSSGMVVDPPAQKDAFDLSFSEFSALRRHYSFFAPRDLRDLSDDVGAGFVGVEVENDVFFAVDRKIYDLLQRVDTPPDMQAQLVHEMLHILEDRRDFYLSRQDRLVSAGLDGSVLLDRRSQTRRRF
jgi:hypothetical protein